MFSFKKKKSSHSSPASSERSASHPPVKKQALPQHGGPYDESDGQVQELLDPNNEGLGIVDFGAYAFVAPRDAQLQIETDAEGQAACRIVAGDGHITLDAYAAPKSGGQWREIAAELAQGLRDQGATVTIQDGPWGREVVGSSGDSVIRFVGVDGPRWTLRAVGICSPEFADEVAEMARNIIRHTLVRRGTQPMPSRSLIPIVLPTEILMQIQAAQQLAHEQQIAEIERARLEENHEPASALQQLDAMQPDD